MEFYLPEYNLIVQMHDVILEASGGKPGIHVDSDIHRATERPVTYAHYAGDYDMDTLCAVMIDAIARYHGFNDGNKRTALMMALFTYRKNDIHFNATMTMNKRFDALVMWVVKKKPEIPEIEKRLKKLRDKFEVETEQSPENVFLAFLKMRMWKERILKKKKDSESS